MTGAFALYNIGVFPMCHPDELLLSYWNNINDSKKYKFIDGHFKIQSLIINSQLCLCSRS